MILILNFGFHIFLITIDIFLIIITMRHILHWTIYWRRLQLNITVYVMNRPVLNWPCDEPSTWWTDRVESTGDETTGDEQTGHQHLSLWWKSKLLQS